MITALQFKANWELKEIVQLVIRSYTIMLGVRNLAVAEIIAVGTELLLGEVVNTNAASIARMLADLGINVYYHCTVGDNFPRLCGVLKQALSRSDIVITTGGLGPTGDDITRECVAEVTGRPLEFSDSTWEAIVSYFRRIGREPTENNRKQAMVIAGAVPLENKFGTAPGLLLEHGGKLVICLPGPPGEALPMLRQVLARLEGLSSVRLVRRTLKVFGMGESAVEQRIIDLTNSSNPSVATYVAPGEVHVRIAAQGKLQEASTLVAKIETEIRSRIGKWVFGADEDTLEKVVGELLRKKGLCLATAESCTGGLLSSRITDVPGSSDYFQGGIVSYHESVKQETLGVPASVLQVHGPVSTETALEMAKAVRQKCKADVGVSVTGFAGPTGGTPDKPVGTVCVAVSGPFGDWSKQTWIRGDRRTVKVRATQEALGSLWLYLNELQGSDTGAAKAVPGSCAT
ncbi:MAG: competence/damage-inducible protein A [Bacillota bacterium]